MENKKHLSERDICTKFITPAVVRAGWSQSQIREEVTFTAGPIVVRGKLASHYDNSDGPLDESEPDNPEPDPR
ncbi:MAG: hypothetical protein HQL90_04970 [Magnetococcales bacterium]|nr:hypothetical protein [Magnetococcales bacterium]